MMSQKLSEEHRMTIYVINVFSDKTRSHDLLCLAVERVPMIVCPLRVLKQDSVSFLEA